MEQLTIALLVLLLGGQAALWHRLGRIEGCLNGYMADRKKEV